MGCRTSAVRQEIEDIEGEPLQMMGYFFHGSSPSVSTQL